MTDPDPLKDLAGLLPGPTPEPEPEPALLRIVGTAFVWATGGYALAMAAGVVLSILLAISGPAFSITTPLFQLTALSTQNGKVTSFAIHAVPFCLSAAGFGALVASLRVKVTGRRQR